MGVWVCRGVCGCKDMWVQNQTYQHKKTNVCVRLCVSPTTTAINHPYKTNTIIHATHTPHTTRTSAMWDRSCSRPPHPPPPPKKNTPTPNTIVHATRHTLITNLGHVGPQLLPIHVPREVAHVHPLRLLGRVQRPAAAPLAPAAGRLPVVAAARLAVLLWWPRVVVWRGGGGVVVSRSTDRVWWWCGGLFPPLPTEKKMPFSLPFSPRRSPALFPPLFPPLPFSLALLASLASPPV